MKRITTIFAAILMTASAFLPQQASAQAPQKMSYQAVVRNSSDALITSSSVGMRIQILQGSEFGAALYVETQTPTTNTNGLASLEIGSGKIVRSIKSKPDNNSQIIDVSDLSRGVYTISVLQKEFIAHKKLVVNH